MPTPAELEAKIKQITAWDELRELWLMIKEGNAPGWDSGEALEYLVLRAFELDASETVSVRYPYEVELFGEKVEEIDGAIHMAGLSCLVESKDWDENVPIAPIAKMRNQLLRRPAGTIGLLFAKRGFTEPAAYLAHFAMPQAVLLWSGDELEIALSEAKMCARHCA